MNSIGRFITACLLVLSATAMGQTVNRVEYFWDTDPGRGSGTRITGYTASANVTVNTAISTARLTPGIHMLGLRGRSSRGLWSATAWHRVVVGDEISRIEYFFDNDPGLDSGIALTGFTPGGTVIVNNASLNATGVSDGLHRLGIRARNGSDGMWSPTYWQQVMVNNRGVTQVEYFYDTDPGYGQGTPFTAFTPGRVVNVEHGTLSATGISDGLHMLGLRARGGSEGMWSPTYWQQVLVNSAGIAAIEYYWDSIDPGIGQATPLTGFTPAPQVNITKRISTAGLAPGIHTLALRARSGNGMWSPTYFHNVFIGMGADYAEYYWDRDPGFGNGTRIPITSDTVVMVNLSNIAVPTTDGLHVLGIRARAGTLWSPTYTQNYCIGPEPRFSLVLDSNVVCQNEQIIILDETQGTTVNTRYTWDMQSDGTVDDTTRGDWIYSYPRAGSYTITMGVGNDNTCQNTVQQHIEVISTANPTVSISRSTNSVCAGTEVVFTATAGNVTEHNAPRFSWYRNDTLIAGATTDTLRLTALRNNDRIHAAVHINTHCAANNTAASSKLTMRIYPMPNVVMPSLPIIYTDQSAFILTSRVAATPTGGIYRINGNEVQLFNPRTNTPGEYEISYTVTNSNGCTMTATDTFVLAERGSHSIAASASPTAGGRVTGGGTFTAGTACTLTATANTYYTFECWKENGNVVSTEAVYTFTVTNSRTLVAEFVYTPPTYSIVVATNPQFGGIVTGGGNYPRNATCTLTATPNADYSFVNWTSGGTVVSTNPMYTFTVTGNRTLTANFVFTTGCGITVDDLPYTENFDHYTTSTTAKTSVEPDCWTLAHQYVSMTDSYKPMVYYSASQAHSGSYSLILNKRGIYAMPELDGDVSSLQMSFYLVQTQAKYQLQVGVMSSLSDHSSFVPVMQIDNPGTGSEFVEVDFASYAGNGRYIAFKNVLASGQSGDYSCNYIDDITLDVRPQQCGITVDDLPYTNNFDHYTTSTTAKTGVEPDCWTLAHQYVSMTDEYKPMVYYSSANAHSGSYSLILNKRGIYAMPEFDGDVNSLQMSFYLKQSQAKYQLQVGVMSDLDDDASFVPVATLNNTSTSASVQHSVSFASYSGNGRYIAFRNTLASGNSGDFSCNYIDDLRLEVRPQPVVYTVAATASPATGGTVTGAGSYTSGSSCTLEATPATGYAFVNWTSGSTVVSTNATYTFTVTADRSLTANFVPVVNCGISVDDLPYTENFDHYTTSTTAKTGVEPDCWTLAHQYVSMTDEYKPMVYYSSANAHSGSYSLILNKRGIYAMPEFDGDVSSLQLSFYLKQTATKYQLQVGVMSDLDNDASFVPVATLNNTSTSASVQQTVSFASYSGNGRYIAFRNTLASGNSGDFSCNYIDDLRLEVRPQPVVYTIAATTSPATGGTVTGAGSYTSGSSCTLAATPATGYAFVNWTSGSTVVSTNAAYTFTVTADRSLTANFVPVVNCGISVDDLPYTENFDHYTTSTTAKTGVEPDCWTLAHQYVSMTDSYKPMVYYSASQAHSGSYSLILNKRGIYAMPEFDGDVNSLQMSFYLVQTAAKYQLQVGVMSNLDDASSFVPVATLNNTSTSASVQHSVSFASYSGNGRYIAFRNTLASGNSGDFSCNYIDDLRLEVRPQPVVYTVAATASPATGGTVTGAGSYTSGSSCTLAATPAAGYAFENWTSGSTVVSTNATYTFTVTGNRTLTANFAPVVNCGISVDDLPYTDNFDHYTTSTTAKTGVEPDCWTLAHQYVSMTDSYKPMVYYSASQAHSGSYSLILNKRGIYAMPEFDGDVSSLQMSFYLVQTQAKYQLQVGVMSSLSDHSSFVPVMQIDNPGTGSEFVEVDFASYAGNGRYIAFKNVLASGQSGDYSCNYIDDITLDVRPQQCGISVDDLPYTNNFDHYTTSTTAKTGVEPDCWTLAHQYVSMTDEYKPMVYYSSANAHSGSYSLILNKRGIYAMPEFDGDVSSLQMSFYLKQPQAKYQLQVGVMSNLDDDASFVPVATLNNTSTSASVQHSVSFASYSGNGRYIAFRNTLASGNSGDFSCNYIDDLRLEVRPQPVVYTVAATASPTTGGTVTGAGSYTSGSSCTLEATPATGYAFVNWTSGSTVVSTNPTYTFTVTGNRTLTANFVPVVNCGIAIADLPFTENFDSHTTSTSAYTGMEPPCWTLALQEVAMSNADRPMIYYGSSNAHSGNYSLILNKRGIYAMPEYEGNINELVMGFYLLQPRASYSLTIGVMSDLSDPSTFTPVATANNSSTSEHLYHEVDFSTYEGDGKYIVFRNTNTAISNYSVNYIDDITLRRIAPPCEITIADLPYSENFDSYTTSTTAKTGVEPDCWTLALQEVLMTDEYKPMIYYGSSTSHSGSYSLILNKRGIYAMPEYNGDISSLQLSFYLRQSRSTYELTVGVMDDLDDPETFEPVASFHNGTTEYVRQVVDFSNYSGMGHYIVFRNTNTAISDYSVNYIDDLLLENLRGTCRIRIADLPYSENFDSYTSSTTAKTGVEPDCWTLAHQYVAMTDEYKPMVYYHAASAHSGSYSLILNKRGIYAMPYFEGSVNTLQLSFYLRQSATKYQLQVGVMSDLSNPATFVPVATFNNSSTTAVVQRTVDFSSYSGSGHYIAFRNILASGQTGDYSCNYIDDITLRTANAAYFADDEAKSGSDLAPETPSLRHLNLYPNPTTGAVNLEADGEIIRVDVFDYTGRCVTTVEGKSTLDLSSFASGIYTLRITLADRVEVRRVVKQ